jgi:hypothetical protein
MNQKIELTKLDVLEIKSITIVSVFDPIVS